MGKIKLKYVIYMCLCENPLARNSDRILILDVYKALGIDSTRPYVDIILDETVPSFESVGRIRRKFQELFPVLRPIESVNDWRSAKQAECFAESKLEKRGYIDG